MPSTVQSLLRKLKRGRAIDGPKDLNSEVDDPRRSPVVGCLLMRRACHLAQLSV